MISKLAILIHLEGWIHPERMLVLHQNLVIIEPVHCRVEGCLRFYTLSEQDIFPRPERCPEGHLMGRGKGCKT